MLKHADIPNLAMVIKTGTNERLSQKSIKSTEPVAERVNMPKKPTLGPIIE